GLPPCVTAAGAGLSAAVPRHVRGSKALGAGLAFLIGTLAGLVSFRPSALRLRVDGSEVFCGDIALAAMATGRYFGGGMHVASEARPDDGLIDVVLIPAMSKLELLMRPAGPSPGPPPPRAR